MSSKVQPALFAPPHPPAFPNKAHEVSERCFRSALKAKGQERRRLIRLGIQWLREAVR